MKAAAVAVLLTAATATGAAEAPTAEALAGQWTLSRMTEAPEVCQLTLNADPTDGGAILHIPFSCYRDFDVEDVMAWGVDPATGAILFNDRRGRPLYRFEPVPTGGYGANEPGWSLDRRPPPPPRT
ncbi:MAG TPA: AprI/Inh family metalloprotease inhibitor, partial [Caulobacteraceae bacterium]|nr:AprI/Inh family metalloprotease inhibitor [Caulobacteraceae bacterium]